MFCFKEKERTGPRVPITRPSASSELAIIDRDLAELQRKIDRRQEHRDQLAAELGQTTTPGETPDRSLDAKWPGGSQARQTGNAAVLSDYDRDTAILTRELDALSRRKAEIKAGT